ncbi:MAG: translesion DNA synthesis-associated protein ImuA [Burkholderiales bacterium]|nr:translesion DNA synthesis-associated protein ImuA [Burkholderiales bacterium]
MSRAALLNPGLLQVWPASELARITEKVVPTGHAALDAQLPGGGWPLGSMVEVLQPQPGQHAWQLILPALAQAVRVEAGPVVVVGAPFEPFGPSLQAQGLPGDRLLKIQADKPAARLWAAEQALRCAEVSAVVAWLPKANAAELRRLHMAAQQQGRLLFVFRPTSAKTQATPARLQLQLEGAQDLQVRILKRRGPPLLQPVSLPAQPRRLTALLHARKGNAATPITRSRSHVLDRVAAPA